MPDPTRPARRDTLLKFATTRRVRLILWRFGQGRGGAWRSLSSRENLVTIVHDSRNFESASDLSQRLGLPFSNLALLTRALTHSSYVNENPDSLEDNERLEFLGDAVLDFIVGAWVYNRFPEMPEGEI